MTAYKFSVSLFQFMVCVRGLSGQVLNTVSEVFMFGVRVQPVFYIMAQEINVFDFAGWLISHVTTEFSHHRTKLATDRAHANEYLFLKILTYEHENFNFALFYVTTCDYGDLGVLFFEGVCLFVRQDFSTFAHGPG